MLLLRQPWDTDSTYTSTTTTTSPLTETYLPTFERLAAIKTLFPSNLPFQSAQVLIRLAFDVSRTRFSTLELELDCAKGGTQHTSASKRGWPSVSQPPSDSCRLHAALT